VFLNAGYGYDIRCEIVGDRGTIALANPARVVTDADRLELQAWVDAVAAGHPSPLASAHDGLIASAVADAVIASMGQDGRRAHVELP
jgi:myo-inositol 2-dehydrogenase/D-chiro-inositol 1-dehydrogenase